MKKLMMAAAIVCAAAAVQAATVNWSQDQSKIYAGKGDATKLTEGTSVYLINAVVHDATTLVSDYVSGDLSAATIKGYAAAAPSALNEDINIVAADGSATGFTEGSAAKAYYVIFKDDNMFVSDTATAMYSNPTTTYTFMFGDVRDSSKALPTSGSYSNAGGWYTAVPEPTSGLLLLLGVAGLALRRRRA